jgi:hypothetical protein
MESILIADRNVRLRKFYDFEVQVDKTKKNEFFQQKNKENKQHKRRETTRDPIANVEPSFSQCKTAKRVNAGVSIR